MLPLAAAAVTAAARAGPHRTLLLSALLLLSARALTITTFNILAPVHRSMDALHHRESEREDWWRPRAEGVAAYISTQLSSSDVILLQEWWFDARFTTVFDSATGDAFERVAERRPGDAAAGGEERCDGLCCLVRRAGALELVASDRVVTGPGRIAQLVHCRERRGGDGAGAGRHVFLANAHLSFPGDADDGLNQQRQADEATVLLEALARAGTAAPSDDERLEVVCGDFNSNSLGRAAARAEARPYRFVNCASAAALACLAHVGGQVGLGTTHCNHLGERVSVDHIFLRLVAGKDAPPPPRRGARRNAGGTATAAPQREQSAAQGAALALGFLDAKGTRILSVRRGDLQLEVAAARRQRQQLLSDHRPVTATIAWPRATAPDKEVLTADMYSDVTRPLDPLEPAWGFVE